MAELRPNQAPADQTVQFADYYHDVEAKLRATVVWPRDAEATPLLNLQELGEDLEAKKDVLFEDQGQRLTGAITQSLEHEVRLVGRLVRAQANGPLLRGGIVFRAQPQPSMKPVGDSRELVEELYSLGANELAVREISISTLDTALATMGMNWVVANLSAIKAFRKVHKNAVYDPLNAEYSETETDEKTIRVLEDHRALVTPGDLRSPGAIASAYNRLLLTRSKTIVQG